MLILLNEGDRVISVNPDYVTLIEPYVYGVDVKQADNWTVKKEWVVSTEKCIVWVKSHSGAGTAEFRVNGTVEEVTNILNAHYKIIQE